MGGAKGALSFSFLSLNLLPFSLIYVISIVVSFTFTGIVCMLNAYHIISIFSISFSPVVLPRLFVCITNSSSTSRFIHLVGVRAQQIYETSVSAFDTLLN
jgi:hypothetical protein